MHKESFLKGQPELSHGIFCVIKGNLEVKLPTKWADDEEERRGEDRRGEKSREEKIKEEIQCITPHHTVSAATSTIITTATNATKITLTTLPHYTIPIYNYNYNSNHKYHNKSSHNYMTQITLPSTLLAEHYTTIHYKIYNYSHSYNDTKCHYMHYTH